MYNKFGKWAAIGLASCLGSTLAQAGDMPCIAPQMVREDQGLGAYQNVPAAGGTFNVIARTSSDIQCGLGVRESSDFLTDLKKIGADKWSYTVLANQGAARTATIVGSSGVSETSPFEIRQAAGGAATPTPAPTPIPTPTPTPTPSATSALSSDLSVLGAQRTCGKVAINTVKSGATLKPGTWVLSPSRQYKLTYQVDGNLVLTGASGASLWSNGKPSPGGSVKMQADGNLVSYSSAGKAVWASSTVGKAGAFLGVQDDGNVVVYAANSCSAAWAIR